MPEEKKRVPISGYELDLDTIVEAYVQGMVFPDGEDSKVVDMDTVKYYIDVMSKKVLLYANIIPASKAIKN